MGMFDEFEMVPPIVCSCGQLLTHLWQSKDGPCGLIKYKQGERVDGEARAAWRGDGDALPLDGSFEVYTHCEEWVDDPDAPADALFRKKKVGCGRFIEKRGVIEGGVWTRVEDGPPEYMTPEEIAGAIVPLTDKERLRIAEQVGAFAGPALLERAFHESLFPKLTFTDHVDAAPTFLLEDKRVQQIAEQVAMLFALGRCIDEGKIVHVVSTAEDVKNGVLKLKVLVPAPFISIELTEPELCSSDGEDAEARRSGAVDRPDQDRGGSDPGAT